VPSESHMITLRVSGEDHDRLRAVANYNGESLSSFIRRSALASANQVIDDVGLDAVLEGDRTYESQRHTDAQRKLAERLGRLRNQADSSSPSDRP
jgi:hypothetical protein